MRSDQGGGDSTQTSAPTGEGLVTISASAAMNCASAAVVNNTNVHRACQSLHGCHPVMLPSIFSPQDLCFQTSLLNCTYDMDCQLMLNSKDPRHGVERG
jgi:hypothetical protein